MRKIALATLLALSTAMTAYADGDEAPITVILAVKMLNIQTGKMLSDQFIIIENERIRDIVTLRTWKIWMMKRSILSTFQR